MGTESITVGEIKSLEKKIAESLKSSNLDELSIEAAEIGVISVDVKRRFDSLDPSVPRPRKIRYLLIHAYEQLEVKPRLLERWLGVLCSHGVPSAVLRKAEGVGTADEGDKCSQDMARLSEEHVAVLVEILASCSGRWRHICTSLNLPSHIEENLEARLHMYDNIMCLKKVLHEWIVGNHKHAKAPTLENLKKALESQLVGLGKTASRLDKDILAKHVTLPILDLCRRQNGDSFCDIMTPSSKKVRLDLINIVSQPLDTKVADEKSTLLEVEAVSTCGNTMSYQWVKDGCPLKDGEHYLGSYRNILCITASLFTDSEGTYTCKVSSTSSESEQQAAFVDSKPVTVTIELSHHKQVLVDMYRAQSAVHRDAWPPVGNRTYINLAFVKQEKLDREDDYSHSTIQGDVDDVILKKESIGYDKAFGEHKSGALLLIEGRPGSGKTTLVHKVSQDWATGKPILKGAKLVFLISLRVLSAKVIVKLPDIMKELFYKNNDEAAQNVLKEINSTNGEGVCFILDGLDEYEKQDSVVFDLIRKAYLPHSMVILSSRPSATYVFRQEAKVYIEVIGFLKTQIHEYISNYPFTCRGSPQNLLAYLNQHPNLLRMCYLPVHMAMVSFLCDKIEGDLPSTECKMYEHFINLTLRRKDGSCPPNSDAIIMRICELAFRMTESRKLFTKDLSPSDTNADHSFGLVTVDCTATLYGYRHLYTFVHLTFQEYLAACYIAKLTEQEQREMISKYGHMDHMRVVWRFYCGLVSFEDEDPKFAKIIDLQHTDRLFHCQCAFESQQPATCKSVVLYHHGSLEFKATHPADFTCLGYVISNSSSLLKSLRVSDISTGDIVAKFHACADVLKQCGQLKYLDIQSNQLGDKGAKVIGTGLRQCSNLSEILLNHNKICDEGAKGLGDGFRQCSNLSVLYLQYNKICDEGAKCLGDGLRQCSKLLLLNLGNNEIGDEGAKGLSDGLQQCSNLYNLCFSSNKIGDEGAKSLSDVFKRSSNLSVLHLDCNKIGGEGAKGLGDSLRQCSKLSELYLGYNEVGNEGAKSLGDGLRQCSNLSKLCISSNKIDDVGAKGLGDGLRHCVSLSFLWLTGNKISEEGAGRFFKELRQGDCKHCSTYIGCPT